jgi:hypothetical protein
MTESSCGSRIARQQTDLIAPGGEERGQVRDLDFGLAVGGGLDFALSGGTLAVDVRYVLPLTRWSDYVENEDPVLTNQGLLVMVGVGF